MTTQQTSVGERLENAARDFRLLQKGSLHCHLNRIFERFLLIYSFQHLI